MGWENGGRYYTRSRKVGGCVLREYVGGGLIGALAADQDAHERRARAIEHERDARAFAQVRHQHRAADALLDALDTHCRELMRIALERAGYHQHERGEWRRRRRATA